MKNAFVIDCEGDSLNPSKIWVVAAYNLEKKKLKSSTNYEDMKKLLLNADIIICHNAARFDVPVLERILKIKIKAKIIDTLAFSWYLYPNRLKHGLEGWGEDLGVPKPPIIRWDDPDMIDEYVNRCLEDVKINTLLWEKMWAKLNRMYDSEEILWEFINYIGFKMDCAREQERSGWKLDIELCKSSLEEMEGDKANTFEKLIAAMPKVAKTVKKTKPAKCFKKDGTWSSHGANWFKRLRENNLPDDYDGEIEEVVAYEEPNPDSTPQVKAWLTNAGWIPQTFKHVRNKETGEVREIPQVNLEHGGGICPSIKKMYKTNPEFELLEGIGVLTHRISILSGFLKSVDKDGYVQAQINGFTNTLRVKHKVVVNLPGVDKPYGKIIRGCLISPEGKELCGSDMSSLEDRLKCHYIYPHDPEYVKEISTPGYDPHMSLAVFDGAMTEKQMEDYKAGIDKAVAPIRKQYKSVNYAAQYGAGGPRIAIAAGTSEAKGKALHKAYWKKNWAIKKVAEEQDIIYLKDEMWLRNPVNGFLYSLRYEKDIFSTLVQGTAAYVFDLWVKEFRKIRPQLTGSFHDEVILCIKEGKRKEAESLLRNAIKAVNDNIKLNRELDIDVQFSKRYSEIH